MFQIFKITRIGLGCERWYMLFGSACTKIYVFPIHLPMYCTSRLIKGLGDRRTNPKFGGAATKILVSSQIAQKRHLRAVWVSESLLAAVWASESFALD